jgi:hypothetical protein
LTLSKDGMNVEKINGKRLNVMIDILSGHLKQCNDDITNLLPVKISETTLRRRRSEENPVLRPENVEAPLRCALEHVNWSLKDWKRVIWSDKSSIWVWVNPRPQWVMVIHPPGEGSIGSMLRRHSKAHMLKYS